MNHFAALFVALALAGSWPASGAAAQSGGPVRYALLIGSNQGGPGQGQLRYAEADARRVAEVLSTLGGYDESRIARLLQPTPADVNAALTRLHERLAAHAAAGEQAQLFFYYSGHARADALNLGRAQLSLTQLRERVLALPTTLSIVVLDACQSGAFSRIKGANRAADFSFNSVERLHTEGVAVIASSSGLELSQESDELESGYFTHHLLVALRGAGDTDRDGRVTLSEAYRYAYGRTLASTAVTAVGEQHVTLETDLQGKGDIALTQPASASARLHVPGTWSGRVLVQHLPSWSVLAELDKAPAGPAIDLAFAPGNYAATVRRGGSVLRCTLQLVENAVTTLDDRLCSPALEHITRAKGEPSAWSTRPPKPPRAPLPGDEGFVLELMAGLGIPLGDDAYQRRLRDFGYESEGTDALRFSVGAGRRVHDHMVVGLSWFNLGGGTYARSSDGITQRFELDAMGVGAWLQGDYSFRNRRFILFARAGAGMVFASTMFDAVNAESRFMNTDPSFEDITNQTEEIDQHYTSPYGAFGAGLQVMPSYYFGFMVELRYAIAPTIDNEIGDTHDVGGFALMTGLRARTWE